MNQSNTIQINQINMQKQFSPENQNNANQNVVIFPANSLICSNNTKKLLPIPQTCKNYCEKNLMINDQLNSISNSTNIQYDEQNPSIKKKKKPRHFFTNEEDEKIKKFVKDFGTKNWVLISFFIKGRTPKQCRDRYINYLVPGIFQGEWTKEEDELLVKLYKENGSKWSVIKVYFPHRSTNSIKNRWSYFLNRKKRMELKNNDLGNGNDNDKFLDINDQMNLNQDSIDFDLQINNCLSNYSVFNIYSDNEMI